MVHSWSAHTSAELLSKSIAFSAAEIWKIFWDNVHFALTGNNESMGIFQHICDYFAHSCYSLLGSDVQFNIIVPNLPELVCFYVFNSEIIHFWIFFRNVKKSWIHHNKPIQVGFGQRCWTAWQNLAWFSNLIENIHIILHMHHFQSDRLCITQ